LTSEHENVLNKKKKGKKSVNITTNISNKILQQCNIKYCIYPIKYIQLKFNKYITLKK